jgi:signal transduction histidine kinase/tetratricopeptide (TPR) repeat protein
MDFFGLPSQLAALDQPVAEPAQEVLRLVTRAWYLRQRDTGAALADAHAAQDLLSTLPVDQAQIASGRLALVRAENAWLFAELDQARALIDEAREVFRWAHDPPGLGDTFLSEAALLEQRGDDPLPAIHAAAQAYRGGVPADPLRLLLADTLEACLALAASPGTAGQALHGLLEQATAHGHPGLDILVCSAHAMLAARDGRQVHAIRHLRQSFDAAMMAGQLFAAICAAQEIAAAFSALHDHEGALQWAQRARDLAQPTGWPYAASRCLVQGAAVMLAAERPQATRELLLGGMPMLQRFPTSRQYVCAAQVLGEALLALGDTTDALSWIDMSERVAVQLRYADLHGHGLALKAQALSGLGRADEALAAAQAGLQIVRYHGDAMLESRCLHAMAGIARAHGMALLAESDEATPLEVNAAIHHLHAAFAAAAQVPGFSVPPQWHAELAQDYEAIGNAALALDHQRRAIAGHQQAREHETAGLSAALQLRLEWETARAAAAGQHALAQAAAERVAGQEATNDLLERLAVIHQELARSPDAPSVFATLGRHVHALLDAQSIGLWLRHRTPDGAELLELAWGVEDGQPLPATVLPAGDAESLTWHCLRERQELHVDLPEYFGDDQPVAAAAAVPLQAAPAGGPVAAPGSVDAELEPPQAPAPLPGTAPRRSALFVPLIAAGEALGVLSIQSPRTGVYGERERHILRSLGAGTAAALAAGPQARRLAELEADLDHERLQGLFSQSGRIAAVRRLARQVAHQMAPPLGSLAELADALAQALEQRRLPGPAAQARSVHRETDQLAQLARRLRSVAASEPPQLAQQDIRSVLAEARSLYGPRLASEHIVCDEAVPAFTVQADAERLCLTIANLVFNAADAMEGRTGKHVWLTATQRNGEVALTVRDNGPGLAHDVAPRLFEPFFTTRPEGLGLGLALAAESLAAMSGRISGGNASEGGAEFTIVLPAA